MPDEPLAYHAICCTHGFWLPNDPRGSHSVEIRADNLRPYGPATTTTETQSVAHVAHDQTLRQEAKTALVYPEVILDGPQALSVGKGFGVMVRKSRYVIRACSILPCHVHLVILRHSYCNKQVVRLLRQAATRQLLQDNRHPFANLRARNGRLPSVWAQDFWQVFLYTEEDIARAIAYVEDNPVKEGKPRQRWSFVTLFRTQAEDTATPV
jgi:REP element-mobilizing transposase RayT